MATLCSTEFRRRLLGPSSFESIFDGGIIQVYSGAQPSSADAPMTGTHLASIDCTPGGLKFQRSLHYATNDVAYPWVLTGVATGTAGWARLFPVVDSGSLAIACIDFAVGLDDDSPGDFQMRLPTLSITPSTTIAIASWWFLLPPV